MSCDPTNEQKARGEDKLLCGKVVYCEKHCSFPRNTSNSRNNNNMKSNNKKHKDMPT